MGHASVNVHAPDPEVEDAARSVMPPAAGAPDWEAAHPDEYDESEDDPFEDEGLTAAAMAAAAAAEEAKRAAARAAAASAKARAARAVAASARAPRGADRAAHSTYSRLVRKYG